ncbi:MAG: hypothetical protein JWR48_6087, partial [Mycobacterium sp.]|nr:hypothetical protein [Mycobacterium sp.]
GREVGVCMREDGIGGGLTGAHPTAKLICALGTANWVGSGAGTTAASATAGCSMSTLFNPNGEIL